MSDTPRTDSILLLIPGGQTCDPQIVADELRPKIAELERELAAERALADRLASVLTLYNHDLLAGEMIQWVPAHDEALAAWKEARREQ